MGLMQIHGYQESAAAARISCNMSVGDPKDAFAVYPLTARSASFRCVHYRGRLGFGTALPQPYARPSTILCDELDASRFEGLLHSPKIIRKDLRRIVNLFHPPEPTIATVEPGATLPFSTPHSKPVGRMSLSMTSASSSAPSGIG